MDNPISKATNWEFLNEPLWRWFVMFGIFILIAATWRYILEYMK